MFGLGGVGDLLDLGLREFSFLTQRVAKIVEERERKERGRVVGGLPIPNPP